MGRSKAKDMPFSSRSFNRLFWRASVKRTVNGGLLGHDPAHNTITIM